jgi:hypothetical protein
MKVPVNPNYCATVVKIDKLVPIENADNLQSAIIFGNSVIVGKNIELETKGLFFPLETQLSDTFLSKHNLFRDKELNLDPGGKVGFFEKSARIRAVKLRGQKSEGFFIPLNDLHEDYKEILSLEVGTDFDYLGSERICQKYVVKEIQERKEKQHRQGKTVPKFNRIIDNQFHLHVDSIQAKKYFDFIKPDDLIWISDKFHGCFRYDTLVTLANGDSMPISEIKVGNYVRTFDTDTNSNTIKRVSNVSCKKSTKQWCTLKFNDREITCTIDHPIFTKNRGWVEASKLTPIDDFIFE